MIYNFFNKICIKIKLSLFRRGCHNAVVHIEGTPRICDFSEIEVGRHSVLEIGSGFTMRKNAIIAVRDNAKLSIGQSVFINRNSIIMARKDITIGNRVTIGPNVCIYDHDHSLKHHGEYLLDSVIIKDNVWIGADVIILKGIIIGENSVISAGSVVTKNVPANSILIQKRDNTLIQK